MVPRRWRFGAGSAAVVIVVLLIALTGPVGAVDTTGTPANPSTTTVPASVPPTTVPNPTPTPSPTLPSTPPTPPTIPAHPTGERSALSPEETAASQAELATLTDTQRSLLRKLQAAKDALAIRLFALVALAREVSAARERLDTARAAEVLARTRVEQTSEQLQRVKDEIVALAAAAYRNHTTSHQLGAIGAIDTNNASTLIRAQTYARSDAMHLDARVEVLKALQRRLGSEQRVAESARAEAERSAADLDGRLAEQTRAVDDARETTTAAQTAVARGLGSGVGLLALIADPKFGADDIAATLAFVQAGQPGPFALDGIFLLPVPGASLSSPYGIRIDPIEGSVGYHAGVDFAADARTPIRAAAAGIVVMSGDCGGYGNCVVIDHGSSLATVYGHESQLLVVVGETVTAGQVIGLVGSTGISTGPHLHLEVRLRGAPIDPVPTLAP